MDILYDTRTGKRYDLGDDRHEIENRRRRRADGTYMLYHEPHRLIPPYDHYGSVHEKMRELERRENELERRERHLEEMERREHRPVGYAAYPMDSYNDDIYWGDDIVARRGRRMRSY